MISAFGVEHGEINKGLPSYLRSGKYVRNPYARHLRAANESGQVSSVMRAQSKEDPLWSASAKRAAKATKRAGKGQKKLARYEINEAGIFHRSGQPRRLP